MAVGLSATQAASLLSTTVTSLAYLQLHTGDPGAAGTANIAVNNTRQPTTGGWTTGSTASEVTATNTAAITWTNVPATEVYEFVTAWTAASSGTFIATFQVDGGAVIATDTFQFLADEIVLVIPTAS